MSDDEFEARIAAMLGAGRHAEAASLWLQRGEPRRAASLYAEVWEWTTAITIAEEAGAFADAYAYAIAGGDHAGAQRLLAQVTHHPEQAEQAASTAEAKGRIHDAAVLREAAGAVERAAELYERAGELGEAARCRESSGRYREAGILYERRLREDPTDGQSALRLGRILAGFGRWDHAARALQAAAESDEHQQAALEMLVSCFDALRMSSAASAALTRLRRIDPEAPLTVPEMLEATFGDPRGLAAVAQGDEGGQLLAGRYRIERTLGAGGTGRVLLAHDGFYDRHVAVKLLTVGSGAQGRDAYARFEREARVAAGLDHPNVVRVYEFNPDGPFLVMEWMQGGTLEDRLQKGALSLAVIHHVLRGILAGLETVHRRGVIHRDLKPANIFFGATGDVKIGDFGTAHLQDLGATLTGAMLGTLAYMAPEQVTGSAPPEAGTDLYALGCILYRMLTGKLPFPGPDFVTQHLSQTPPPPSAERPAVGARFDSLVAHLLQKPLEARPTGVEAVRQAVETIDWSDPEHHALQALVKREGTTTKAPEPMPEPSSRSTSTAADRYTLIEPREGGGYLAQDELLGRAVRIEPVDERRAELLRQLARADGPHLQAVFDLDVDAGRAILEEPAGSSLARVALEPARRQTVGRDLRAALARIHATGGVHGAIVPSAVRVAPGRAVLMLPAQRSEASPQDDLRALDAILGEAGAAP